MSNIHAMPHTKKPRLEPTRLHSPRHSVADTRQTVLRQTRRDITLDLLRRVLHTYLYVNPYMEEERIIKW
jgi:hypothetical protein